MSCKEHESEYGTHWNFFLTLAIIPIFQVMLHPVILYVPIAFVGVAIALGMRPLFIFTAPCFQLIIRSTICSLPTTSGILHPYCASNLGDQCEQRRDSFTHWWVKCLSIVTWLYPLSSPPGYLAIHMLGLSAGTIVLPPSPSYFRRRKQDTASNGKRRSSDAGATKAEDLNLGAPRQTGKTATELCSYSIMWWSFLGFAKVGGRFFGGGEVSRRMVCLIAPFWSHYLFSRLL